MIKLIVSQFQAKIVQYPDDTVILVSDTKSVVEALETIKIFEACSGSKFNLAIGKSEGIWFGKYYGCPESPVPILNWITKDIERVKKDH